MRGGSNKIQPAESIVKGVKTPTDKNMISGTSVENRSGEELSRFDLDGVKNETIKIAANPDDPSKGAYDYEVGNNHDGVAYVWAPAVNVKFWDNKAMENNTLGDMNAMRGNTLVKSGADIAAIEAGITVPEGKEIVWKNVVDDSVFKPGTDKVLRDMNVYYEFKDKEKPAEPATPGKDKPSGDKTVGTGDSTPLALGIILLLASMAGIGYAGFRRKYSR